MKTPLLLIPLLFPACVASVDSQGDDPIGQSFLDAGGKTDAFGIAEGSPDAIGVLALVNSADAPLLTTIGVATHARESILAHRDGPDGIAGTSDDEPFGTLAELDAVPYVGLGAFSHLLDYARAHGYVPVTLDPFDPTSCGGPTISQARLQAVTDGGTAPFPAGTTWRRSRRCSTTLGCSTWSTPETLDGQSTVSYHPSGTHVVLSPDFFSEQQLQTADDVVIWDYSWGFAVDVGPPSSVGLVTGAGQYWDGPRPADEHAVPAFMFDTVTAAIDDGCLRAYADWGKSSATDGRWTELEAVMVVTF